MDCTCFILTTCILINIVLIVLVAFQQDRHVIESPINHHKYDFELISKELERFNDNMYNLDVNVQGLSNQLFDSNEHLVLIDGELSKFASHSDSELGNMKGRMDVVRAKFHHLNNKFDEIKNVIDRIKKDVEEIEMAFYKLELQSLKEEIEQEERLEGDVDSNDYYVDKHDDVSFNFGVFASGIFTNEDKSNSSHPLGYEGSASNESISHLKTFHLLITKANWTEAMWKCEDEGMQLVSISSRAEQTAIVDLIKTAGLGNEDFWTSGNDFEKAGTFVWAKTGSLVTYSNWNTGEPNNTLTPGLEEQEHCLSLVYQFDYKWGDSVCAERKYSVCQKLWLRNK